MQVCLLVRIHYFKSVRHMIVLPTQLILVKDIKSSNIHYIKFVYISDNTLLVVCCSNNNIIFCSFAAVMSYYSSPSSLPLSLPPITPSFLLSFCRRVQFDHLDKAFCIMKLTVDEGDRKETVIIRRVDLIVTPPEQYPFSLVSWTGSKVC